MEKIVLGIDIGGSHITAALIDIKNKQEIAGSWSRNRIDSYGSTASIISAWSETITKAASHHPSKPDKVYIAMPGPMQYPRGICMIKSQDKYRDLYNKNLKQLLASQLGMKTSAFHFRNDAACFLKGEVFCGSLDGYQSAIGLTLGTGLGSAHFSSGKSKDADYWNMSFQKGIAEDYLSTGWFIKRYAELSGKVIKDVKDLVENHASTPEFTQLFNEFSKNLASFLHRFIRKKMPEAAVIGGNIVHADQYFLSDTRKYLAEMMGYSFPVKKSTLGEKAILMGAASTGY